MSYAMPTWEVEAHRWFKNGDHPDDNCEFFEGADGPFTGEGKVVRYYRHPKLNGQEDCPACGDVMHNHGWIDEGDGDVVCPGDYVVQMDTDSHFAMRAGVFEALFKPKAEASLPNCT